MRLSDYAYPPAAGLLRRVPIPLPPGPPRPTLRPALRVGLLGGAFNPAHAGHLYLSIEARRRLRLDQVWWLVTPQHPLKPQAGMAPLAQRLAGAKAVARHPSIVVSPLEARLGTRYTVDTLGRLRSWPGHRFVWLIGADNLVQMPLWRRWTQLMATVPVAVVERHPYSYAALEGAAASRFAAARLDESEAAGLADRTPPAWIFLRLRPHPASSTAIRSHRDARPGSAASPSPAIQP